MCGRYHFSKEVLSDISQIVREIDRSIHFARYEGDIHPTDAAPVIVSCKNGLILTEKRWGFPGGSGSSVIFNARAESALDKRMFARGILCRRAVIPADRFYEWNRQKEKSSFRREDSPILYMAGFYDSFDGTDRFVILTTAANQSVIQIHDRMPLILEKHQIEDWIHKDDAAGLMLKQTPVMLIRESEYEQQTLWEYDLRN